MRVARRWHVRVTSILARGCIVGIILRWHSERNLAVLLALESLHYSSDDVSDEIILATIAIVLLSRPLILIVVLELVIIVTSVVTIVSASTVAMVL